MDSLLVSQKNLLISKILDFGFSSTDFDFNQEPSERNVETVYYTISYRKYPEWRFFLPASFKQYRVFANPWLNIQNTYEETNSFDVVILFFGRWLTSILNEDVPDLFSQAMILNKECTLELDLQFIIDFSNESNFSSAEKSNYQILLADLVKRIEALEIEQDNARDLINQLKATQDLVEKGATKKQIKQTLIGVAITEGVKQIINKENMHSIWNIISSAVQEHLPKLLN